MQQFSQNDDLIVNYRPWKTLQSYDNDNDDGPILDEGITKLQGSSGKGMLISNFHRFIWTMHVIQILYMHISWLMFPHANELTTAMLIPKHINPIVILNGWSTAKIIFNILDKKSLFSAFLSWYSICVDSSLSLRSSVFNNFIILTSFMVFLRLPREYFSCSALYCSLTCAMDRLISLFFLIDRLFSLN